MGSAALAKCEACAAACEARSMVAREWDPTGRPRPAPAFESLFDGLVGETSDGQVSKEAWIRAFEKLDADGSGKVSRTEWVVGLGHAQLFDLVERRQPGVISREEWLDAFKLFDRNANGSIDMNELAGAHLKPPKRPASSSSSRAPTSRRSASSTSTRRRLMDSCVQPSPTAKALAEVAREGYEEAMRSSEGAALLHAMGRGCLASATRIVRSSSTGAWQLCCDEAGETALHLAVRQGDIHLAGLLVKHRAMFDARNMQGEVALHEACRGSYVNIVELLLSSEADPRMGDLANAEVPAMLAVRQHARLAQALGRRGGAAPWRMARGSGPPALAPLPSPADASAASRAPAKKYRERGLVCIETCLEAMRWWDPQAPPAVSLIDARGVTGLHAAAEASDCVVCRMLLAFDALVDAADGIDGATPLMYALRAGASEEAPNERGVRAASEGQRERMVVALLLEAGADPRRQDRLGGAPLHYAVAAGDAGLGATRRLVAARADINCTDERGASAVAIAGLRGAPATLRYLLATGARPHGCSHVLHEMPATLSAPGGRTCREILEAVSHGGPVVARGSQREQAAAA